VIVSQAMARLHFPNENPLGKHITVYMTSRNEPCEIIGVVGDVKSQALDVDTRSMVYWPHAELPYSALTLVVRSNTDPAAVTSAIQREVRALDKNQPISEMHSMKELLADSISRSRFATTLLSIFAAIAVILATIGIYGVMAYAVTQRTNEIGIRIALGASRREVLTLILRRGLAMTTIGVATGLLGSLAITRVLSNLLFGVSATDPITFVGVAMGLIAVAIVATCIPALRATRIDPLVALRYE
jgi:putative ABC transport system permease protein